MRKQLKRTKRPIKSKISSPSLETFKLGKDKMMRTQIKRSKIK